MTGKTMFYAVFDKKPERIPDYAWTLWLHCSDDPEITRGLVINRHIRNRGGFDDLKELFLYEHPADAPRHPNGSPAAVTAITYSIHPRN